MRLNEVSEYFEKREALKSKHQSMTSVFFAIMRADPKRAILNKRTVLPKASQLIPCDQLRPG